MDAELRKTIAEALESNPATSTVVTRLDLQEDGSGTITYNSGGVWVDPSAPGFSGTSVAISDEEMVRAYLLVRLADSYRYPPAPTQFEIERVYKPVGRPVGKGGRIDVVVREMDGQGSIPRAFLFVECKAPSKFDADLQYIDGQLFRLSRQESVRPKYLVYYTVEYKAGSLRDRVILVDTDTFPDFASWDKAGQPITDAIPIRYGTAEKRRYANVKEFTETHRPLDREATAETFSRLRTEIHDVIWGGGGTNNNEVFVLITRLILCKIFDEKETPPGDAYRFQRLGDAVKPESPDVLVQRLNELYKQAEEAYLALPEPSSGPAFDTSRVSAEKIAYVVGRLEGLSITENLHSGDLLGEFFEQIVAQDFTQTKGQFFTPVKIVRFMLHLADAGEHAHEIMLHARDHLGRPRLPYVIDPACGSGTFLLEYMKLIRRELGGETIAETLPNRIRDAHAGWFSGHMNSDWAREFLFAVENNYDLGLAAKVNMVLHGDGSMNTWIASALSPFEEYWIEGRNNVLGIRQPDSGHPYPAARNEQFDFVISNPPFSLTLSPDEKLKVAEAFETTASMSEAIFIERWYQLLREGSRFCCILPEAILDTSTSLGRRLFLIQAFRIDAVVSLPYDAFRPFTSTKTCIVLATKRSAEEERSFKEQLAKYSGTSSVPSHDDLLSAVDALGWADDPIFMAEPAFVGYKRRKNLPDLPQPNELYREDQDGQPAPQESSQLVSVLDYYRRGPQGRDDARLGFRTSLRNVFARSGIRLDPKYRWLWDFQKGIALGTDETARSLSTFLDIVELPKVPKGELGEEATVIDLEYVESRQAIIREPPTTDTLGSDKVELSGCDLAISKLEPYLGKIIVNPPEGALGSTEWVGLLIKGALPPLLVAYLLMHPQMCEAYRRLQSGKRHARFDPVEFLDLRAELPPKESIHPLSDEIATRRDEIVKMRQRENEIRKGIDSLFA